MPLADRFAEYVAELHEVCDRHRLRHGKPEDLSRLLEAFKDSESFATDFGCVMRSIVLRESFRASETELLTLVAVAWAGTVPDDSTPRFSQLIQELRGILSRVLAQRVLFHRPGGLITNSAEGSEKGSDMSSNLSDPTRELGEINPNVHMHRQRTANDSHEKRNGGAQDFVSDQHGVRPRDGGPDSSCETPQKSEQALTNPSFPFYEASEKGLTGKVDRSNSSDYALAYGLGTTGEVLPALRLKPSAAEILALGLTGLTMALLFSTGSLPVYRARVSLYLPSAIAGTTNSSEKPTGPAPGVVASGSREASLLNGELAEKVAEGLLARPHTDPILRQDVLSKGLRDLHLGGSEPILYADLVAETVRQVKVTHLQPQNLYEVTCDSWDAQFAATFCNELTDSLNDQPSIAISSQDGAEPARTIDAALRPGIMVYPHWYLQGSVGLGVGCLVGFLVGFVKRPGSNTIKQTT